MYNEVKRFYLFRKRRWADTIFDTLYHIIFILGFCSILKRNPNFRLLYFYYYFILTHVVSLGNEELEYEIRSGQSFGILYSKGSIYRIYIQRAMIYFLWLTFIFLNTIFFINRNGLEWFVLKLTISQSILTVLICLFILLSYYLIILRLTVYFHRISVLVDFINTILLFYSGLVFPVISFVNLRRLFNFIIRN